MIYIDSTGKARMVYDDDLTSLYPLGNATVKRASYVEPRASGEWMVDLSPCGGPVLGPFPKRQLALDAEREWLDGYLGSI